MFYEKIYPRLLVVIQLSCLVFIAVTGPLVASGYAGILVESAGVFLAIVAIYSNGLGNFNITPIPKQGGRLVTSGPYRLIRHPMYTAQLVAVLPLVIDHFTYLRLAAILTLFFVLLLKIHYEEKALKQAFKEYEAYIARSKKLVPFIY